MRLKYAGFAASLLLLFTSASLCQENRFDVSLGATAVFSKESSGNGTVLAPTTSAGFLATARYRFTAKSAIALNYGFSRNSQKFISPPNDFRIQGKITEFTAAYVFTPFETPRAEPFILGGIGLLSFDPETTFVNAIETSIPAVRKTQVAFLYGGGLDYRAFSSLPLISRSPISAHLALRLQYRGLAYKAPDFGVGGLFTGKYGHLAEPSVGLVFKF